MSENPARAPERAPEISAEQRQRLRDQGAVLGWVPASMLGMETERQRSSTNLKAERRRRVALGTDEPIPRRAKNLDAVKEWVETLPEVEPHAMQVLSGDAEDTIANSGRHLPQSTPPLIFDEEENRDPTIELRRNSIFQLWMRGYDIATMAKKLGMSFMSLKREIRIVRARLSDYIRTNPDVFGGPVETLYLQIVRRRERQKALWEEIEDAETNNQKPAFFRLLAEEDTAIEKLLGMDRKTLAVTVGSPMEQAQADLFRSLGPTGLKELLDELRRVYPMVADGESIRTIDVTPTSAGQVLR